MVKRTVYSLALVAIVAAAAGTGWFVWQRQLAGGLPAGFVSVNGRIEATEVDVATKLAGRIVDVRVNEGDLVAAGAVVATLDRQETEAQLRQAQAATEAARQAQTAAEAAVGARQGELALAQKELQRAATLAGSGVVTHEIHDQQEQRLTTATSALAVASAQVAEATAAVDVAQAAEDHMQALQGETDIKAPVRGRVQYRLAEPGSVLPAGGRIAMLLDVSDVSMTVFLPAYDAGRLVIGDEARVVLDAAPDFVFPATVAFVSAEAQFTPKTVETAAEREKLMFRVKLRAPPEVLKKFEDRVMSGLRGMAYLRTDRTAQWPDRLAVKLPKQ